MNIVSHLRPRTVFLPPRADSQRGYNIHQYLEKSHVGQENEKSHVGQTPVPVTAVEYPRICLLAVTRVMSSHRSGLYGHYRLSQVLQDTVSSGIVVCMVNYEDVILRVDEIVPVCDVQGSPG